MEFARSCTLLSLELDSKSKCTLFDFFSSKIHLQQ